MVFVAIQLSKDRGAKVARAESRRDLTDQWHLRRIGFRPDVVTLGVARSGFRMRFDILAPLTVRSFARQRRVNSVSLGRCSWRPDASGRPWTTWGTTHQPPVTVFVDRSRRPDARPGARMSRRTLTLHVPSLARVVIWRRLSSPRSDARQTPLRQCGASAARESCIGCASSRRQFPGRVVETDRDTRRFGWTDRQTDRGGTPRICQSLRFKSPPARVGSRHDTPAYYSSAH